MIYTKDMIKKEIEKKEKVKRTLRYLYIPIIIFLILGCISIIFQKLIEKDNFANVFGLKSFTVLTGSMEPEINAGDVVIVKNIAQKDIKVGDVITYSVGNSEQTVTHRVTEIVQQNGKTYYKTKGDNNNSADSDLVEYANILGTVGFKIAKLGLILNALKTTGGIAFLALLILISWAHSSKKNDRILAREEARKKYNICKYKKDGEDVNGAIQC